MNKKVYLSDLEWTRLKRGYYISGKPDFLNKGGLKATIIFNDTIPYDEFEKISKIKYFNITDEDYKSRINKARNRLLTDISLLKAIPNMSNEEVIQRLENVDLILKGGE